MVSSTCNLGHFLVGEWLEQGKLGWACASTQSCITELSCTLTVDLSITSKVQNVTLATGHLCDTTRTMLDHALLGVLLAQLRLVLDAAIVLLIVLIHAHATEWFAVCWADWVFWLILTDKLVDIFTYLFSIAWSLVLGFFRNVVVCLIEVIRGCYCVLVYRSATESILHVLVLLLRCDALRPLRPVGWVP
jgi:hypothetical protein